jgi:hypothetical protein
LLSAPYYTYYCCGAAQMVAYVIALIALSPQFCVSIWSHLIMTMGRMYTLVSAHLLTLPHLYTHKHTLRQKILDLHQVGRL